MVKNPPASAGDVGLIPGSGGSPGGGNDNPLQSSWLGNPMDRVAWVAESDMTGDRACKPFKIQSNFNITMHVYRKHLFQTWQWKVSPPFHLHHHHPVSRFLFSEATTPLFSYVFFHWCLQTYTQLDICISPFYSENSYSLHFALHFALFIYRLWISNPQCGKPQFNQFPANGHF